MAWNMVIAASETADIFTLGNDVFTEILTALYDGSYRMRCYFRW